MLFLVPKCSAYPCAAEAAASTQNLRYIMTKLACFALTPLLAAELSRPSSPQVERFVVLFTSQLTRVCKVQRPKSTLDTTCYPRLFWQTSRARRGAWQPL